MLRCARPAAVDALYVHVPFCFHKCHYCDFYSIVDTHDRQHDFTDRLIAELRTIGAACRSPLRTIFVGGGTPTLLAVEHWRRLLVALREAFDLARLEEFTVEANPETVTAPLLDVLVAGGVNRMSIGAQSFDADHLKTLERWHDPTNVDRAVALARAAGIANLNVDLIYAIPGQSLDQWRADLDRAIALGTQHLSCYALTYEPGTPMTVKLERGRIERSDNAIEAAMFETTATRLAESGFERYEVSNFARAGRRCEHNLVYWRNGNWLAAGPSASGHLDGLRWKNQAHLGRYLASTGGAPIGDVERLDADGSLGERLMLGLRLAEGVEWSAVAGLLGDRRRAAIEQWLAMGRLEVFEDRLRFTPAGLIQADGILADLL